MAVPDPEGLTVAVVAVVPLESSLHMELSAYVCAVCVRCFRGVCADNIRSYDGDYRHDNSEGHTLMVSSTCRTCLVTGLMV
jgi:hypothetical protein